MRELYNQLELEVYATWHGPGQNAPYTLSSVHHGLQAITDDASNGRLCLISPSNTTIRVEQLTCAPSLANKLQRNDDRWHSRGSNAFRQPQAVIRRQICGRNTGSKACTGLWTGGGLEVCVGEGDREDRTHCACSPDSSPSFHSPNPNVLSRIYFFAKRNEPMMTSKRTSNLPNRTCSLHSPTTRCLRRH